MQVDCNDRKRKWINKKLFGCPVCQRPYYVVLTENIKNKYYHYRELYCHSCNVLFSPIHAVAPIEPK